MQLKCCSNTVSIPYFVHELSQPTWITIKWIKLWCVTYHLLMQFALVAVVKMALVVADTALVVENTARIVFAVDTVPALGLWLPTSALLRKVPLLRIPTRNPVCLLRSVMSLFFELKLQQKQQRIVYALRVYFSNFIFSRTHLFFDFNGTCIVFVRHLLPRYARCCFLLYRQSLQIFL